MSISPARVAAFDILLRVERESAYAAELLHSLGYAELSTPDHALLTELVMGVLRWRSLLDQRIAEQSSQRLEKLDPEVLTALRIGAYQVGFLSRVPQRAAVHESVELVKRARKRSAVPFVNAVLRKLSTATHPPGAWSALPEASSLAEIAATYAHPLWILKRWGHSLGLDAVRQISKYDQAVPQTCIRLSSPHLEDELKKNRIETTPGSLVSSARRVLSGNVATIQAFREGQVAIQDEASQLVALLVGKGSNILDCCAAPGGKTRILASRNPGATILAAEVHSHRARLLRKLVPESNVRVIAADVLTLPVLTPFDRVLVDVPCSGTGTLAHNPEIKWRLKPEDLQDLHARQAAILKSAMQRVAPGGRLIYSTCSLEPEENEAVVEEGLVANPAFRVLDCHSELQKLRQTGELAWEDLESLCSGPYLRTLPGIHPCDGFFAAMLHRA